MNLPPVCMCVQQAGLTEFSATCSKISAALIQDTLDLWADALTQEEGPVLLEESDALLQVLAAQAPPVVKAVERVQPGNQDQVQGLACNQHCKGHDASRYKQQRNSFRRMQDSGTRDVGCADLRRQC